jgi:hypothetical protein
MLAKIGFSAAEPRRSSYARVAKPVKLEPQESQSLGGGLEALPA